MKVRDTVIARFRQDFGPPIAESAAACCWRLPGNVEVIVQKDSPPKQTNVWMPWRVNDPFPDFAEFFDGGMDRPKASYHPACPWLSEGKPALALPIFGVEDIDRAIAHIKRCSGLHGATE